MDSQLCPSSFSRIWCSEEWPRHDLLGKKACDSQRLQNVPQLLKILPKFGPEGVAFVGQSDRTVKQQSQRQVGAATSGSLDLPRTHQPHFDASPVPLDVVGVERDGHGQRSCVRARTCPIAAFQTQCSRCTCTHNTIGIILPAGPFLGRILVPLYCWRSSRIDIADLPRRVSLAWPAAF